MSPLKNEICATTDSLLLLLLLSFEECVGQSNLKVPPTMKLAAYPCHLTKKQLRFHIELIPKSPRLPKQSLTDHY